MVQQLGAAAAFPEDITSVPYEFQVRFKMENKTKQKLK